VRDVEDEAVTIVSVDLPTGKVTELQLPHVTIGVLEEVDIGEEWFPLVGANPAVVWDGTRALVVHADRDVVTEVDLETGAVTDHPFGPETSESAGLLAWLVPPAQAGGMPSAESTRSAVLSPDGGRLYVATRLGQAIVESEDDWYLRTDSVGLKVVDTKTWTLVNRLDAPIGEVDISPDGTRLLASGFTRLDRLSSTDFESHGVFVIDTSSLEVLAHHEGLEEWFSPISFSADGRFGYVSTWTKTDVIDLESGNLIRTVTGSGMPLWGEIGVMTAPSTR
jgi:DNA-binding beta-propeller fold protein YncE